MKELAKQFRVLGNERRLKIVVMLKRRRRTVSEIARELKLSFRSTSRHLQVLKHAGVIESEQVGLSVWYGLRGDHALLRIISRFIFGETT